MGSPSTPKAPNPAKTYDQGIQIYLQHLPELLAAEQNARTTYDPQRIADQQALQAQFGPTQYQQQLDALNQIDPLGQSVRNQLGTQVSNDLASGYDLPPELATQLEGSIRGAQAARGNTLGAAPASAEALFKGQNAINLYQQHLNNAGQFLGLATPEQQISLIQPVSADRSSAYTNPNAGYAGQQFGLQNYQNLLAGQQLSSGNPWGSALAGAASGAAAGSAAGGWGAVIGGLAGGVGGYLSSDRRLKCDIDLIGQSESGLNIYLFRYNGQAEIFSGVMADEVVHIPGAVSYDPLGYAMVDYSKLDVPFERIS